MDESAEYIQTYMKQICKAPKNKKSLSWCQQNS